MYIYIYIYMYVCVFVHQLHPILGVAEHGRFRPPHDHFAGKMMKNNLLELGVYMGMGQNLLVSILMVNIHLPAVLWFTRYQGYDS